LRFAFAEDQELLRSTTRRFLEDRHPIAALRPRLEEAVTFDREVWQAGASLGWTALLVPEDHDGGSVTDQPVVDLAALSEELGRQLYPGPVLGTNVVADAVATFGNTQGARDFLGPIARGETVATWCHSEDGTPDLAAVGVVARLDGDEAHLDGVARFVQDAHVADALLVTCRSPGGVLLVLVSVPNDGVSARVLAGFDLTRRFCEVRFAGVVVSRANVLGGDGVAAVDRAQRLVTVLQAAEAVGAGEHLFEMTVQYAKDRVQFGRPIGSFQAIKHRLADLLNELEAARAASRYAAMAVADERHDRDEAVAVAGSFVRDAIAHLCGESLQIHGGIGFTWEHDVHLFLRRAKADQVLHGEPAWHRERLLGLVETLGTEAGR